MKRWVDQLTIELPHCPGSLTEQQVLLAARDYCRDAGAWEEDVSTFEADGRHKPYEMDRDWFNFTDGLIDKITGVKVNGERLDTFGFRGRSFLEIPDNTRGTVTLRAFLIPDSAASTLPDVLHQYHWDAIACGAKSRLMRIPAVDWSNPQLAQYYTQLYHSYVGQQKAEMARQHTSSIQRVKPRAFI